MFNVRAGLAIGAAAVLVTAGALVAAHRPEPAPAPGSAITSAEISQADGITVSMTDQIADSDTCSFSAGTAAEHCGGFLDSPSGGTQQGTGSFTGTMTATVQVDNTNGLTTPATGVVLDFLTALNEHEGDGDGRPGTGHTEVMADAAGTDEYNINKWLEASIRSTSAQLGDDAEVELAADEKELFRLSRDPLVPVWQGTLRLWNPRTMKWTSDKCTVGPTKTCE